MHSLIDRLASALSDIPGIRLAVLFGSMARGTTTPGSDVDVGILFAADSTDARRLAGAALGRAVMRDLDVVSLEEASPHLRFEIARDGRPLFQADPHVWSEFRARAMLDWWDWAPTARKIHTAAAQRLRSQIVHGPS